MKAKVTVEDQGVVMAAFEGQPTGYSVARQGAVVTVTIMYLANEAREEDLKRAKWNPAAARA